MLLLQVEEAEDALCSDDPDAALQLLTSALSCPVDVELRARALHSRCTCLLALQDAPAALADACTMLSLQPHSEDGLVLKATALLALELVGVA